MAVRLLKAGQQAELSISVDAGVSQVLQREHLAPGHRVLRRQVRGDSRYLVPRQEGSFHAVNEASAGLRPSGGHTVANGKRSLLPVDERQVFLLQIPGVPVGRRIRLNRTSFRRTPHPDLIEHLISGKPTIGGLRLVGKHNCHQPSFSVRSPYRREARRQILNALHAG